MNVCNTCAECDARPMHAGLIKIIKLRFGQEMR